MLTAAEFDQLTTPIVDLYEEYAQTVINDIARRLAKMNFKSPSAAWQMQRLIESGKTYQEALRQVAKLTGKSERTLKGVFARAGVQSLRFDDAIYKAAGLNPLPLNLSPAMLDVLLAGIKKTNKVISNMTKTTAKAAQESFVHASTIAYQQVTTGTMSYDQAIRAAIKKVANDGLTIIDYPSGHHDQVDVAVRRAVLTGVAQTTATLQDTRMDELGVDLVQTSAHQGARPTHEAWQGRIFSRSGKSSKYPDFVQSTGYGLVTGLAGANCRHSYYPFFPGLSTNAYNKKILQEMANKRVKYRGQVYTQYEASQIQRSLERKVRKWKREAAALAAGGQDNRTEIAMVKSYQAQLRDFVKQTGMYRQPEREGPRVPVVKAPARFGEALPGAAPAADLSEQERQEADTRIRDTARKLGFPVENIIYEPEEKTFKVGDKTFSMGGYYSPPPEGSGERHGTITVKSAYEMDQERTDYILSHEIQHDRWQYFKAMDKKHNSEIMAEMRATDDQKAWPIRVSGELRTPELEAKYWGYDIYQDEISGQFEELRRLDGVSDYSTAYWEALEKYPQTEDFYRAIDETLAEIARLEFMFPAIYREGIDPKWKTLYERIKARTMD